MLRLLDLGTGGGGLALGLSAVGFEAVTVVETDRDACQTIAVNRPDWTLVPDPVTEFDARTLGRIDVISARLPSPLEEGRREIKRPELIWNDSEVTTEPSFDWTPQETLTAVLENVARVKPSVVVLEHVRNMATRESSPIRLATTTFLQGLGYSVDWQLLHAYEFGVPQTRPRFYLIAMRTGLRRFSWPRSTIAGSVGQCLHDLMSAGGWSGASAWAAQASGWAPTLVGGSRNRGGADLGPSGTRALWAALRVEGKSLENNPPDASFPVDGSPRLTLEMVQRLQGFPDSWIVFGNKAAKYRQLAGSSCPPVAAAIGRELAMSTVL